MINVRNLTKSIQGTPFLSGVNVYFAEGELVVILGASGSGKSTLLRCLTFREQWDDGKLFYKDQDLVSMGWFKRRMLMKDWTLMNMNEQPDLNPRRSAYKNVLSGSRRNRPLWRLLTGMISKEERTGAMDYLNKVGLLNKDLKQVEKLSGGEVTRIALAKALATKAKVIVAEEPVSDIDPHTAESILADIRQICTEEGLLFICTLPQIELAEKHATRLIGLKDGDVAFDVTGRRLRQAEKDMIL